MSESERATLTAEAESVRARYGETVAACYVMAQSTAAVVLEADGADPWSWCYARAVAAEDVARTAGGAQ